MTTIVTRAGKGSPLTNSEMDANLNNLNNDKLEAAAIANMLETADIGSSVQAYDADIATVAASQAEMEGGTEAALRSMSPLRIKQAIAALAGSSKQIQPITASVAANALTITLNPTSLDFRSATLGSGTVNNRSVASALTLTISSGSTLGTVNAIQNRLVVIAIDNAGTVELAIANIAGGVQLDETNLISTTAEGGAGAADSATVVYSTTARTSVPYRVVGYVESTQATAGTWATAPSTIQGTGGVALAGMNSLGYGQTWQLVTRSSGTTYYNTTGRPIGIKVEGVTNSGGGGVSLSVNSVSVGYIAFGSYPAATTAIGGGFSVIPPGMSYVLTDVSMSTRSTYELR